MWLELPRFVKNYRAIEVNRKSQSTSSEKLPNWLMTSLRYLLSCIRTQWNQINKTFFQVLRLITKAVKYLKRIRYNKIVNEREDQTLKKFRFWQKSWKHNSQKAVVNSQLVISRLVLYFKIGHYKEIKTDWKQKLLNLVKILSIGENHFNLSINQGWEKS